MLHLSFSTFHKYFYPCNNWLEGLSLSQWNVNFLIVAHDWEVDVFTLFFNLLYSFRLRRSGEDKLCWVPSKKGLFNVRSYYNALALHDNTPFSWKSILRNKAPMRVAFFAWSAILGKILTMDNLRKRHAQ
jgi:hypothetical protein